jgi:hypothetical protein
MFKLYRSPLLLTHWVAHCDALGWVMFPAKANGWTERKPYRDGTERLMRIPPRLGFNTGFPHPEASVFGALRRVA